MTFEVRTFEARTVSWWYRLRQEIDFDPPYQRKGQAWDRSRKAFLIDTILNDFDMPKLYLADFTYFRSPLNASGARFAVIDGKQRFAALFDFLDDVVPLAPDFVLREDPDLDLAGMTYTQLREAAPSLAAKVENFNLPVMSVITDDDTSVQELFVRLNSGKPLTPAERRNALPGEVPNLVREIASSPFFVECVAFSNRGGAYEQAAAKLLLLEHANGPIDLKRKQLDAMYSQGASPNSSRGDVQEAATVVLEILLRMGEVFEHRDPLLRSQGQLPVYFLLFREGQVPDGARAAVQRFHEIRLAIRRAEQGSQEVLEISQETRENVAYYDRLMRNPNDAKSVFVMYEILSLYVRVDFEMNLRSTWMGR